MFQEHVVEEAYDILGISETWLDGNIKDFAINIPDYKLTRKDRETRGGGVAFYVRNSIKYKVVKPVTPTISSLEHLWISTKIGGKKFCLGTLYRPPNANLNLCIEDLETILTGFLPDFDYVIFGGDFNVDVLNFNHSNTKQLISFFEKYSLHQLITQPTRLSNTTSTLIDIIVTTNKDIAVDSDVFKMDEISDHSLVSSKFKIKKDKPAPLFRTYRNFVDFDYNDFVRDLNSISWDLIYSLENVDEMVNFWNENITKLFDKHAPYKTVRITKSPAPWLNDNLKLMMKLRDKARSLYKKNKSEVSFNEYKQLRNLVNRSVQSEKKAYLDFKARTDPKNFWKTLRYLNINSRESGSPAVSIDPNKLNDFFVNNIPKPTPPDANEVNLIYKYENQKHPNVFSVFNFTMVSEEKVELVLRKLKSNAMGADGINLKMLDLIFPHLTIYFTFIINKCLARGSFPKAWKDANVIPLPKNSSPLNLSDFRPISILPTLSKVLEKIVSEQLDSYLSEKRILPTIQSGFRANHSTTTALLNVTDDIFRANDEGKNTCLVLLDFSKAFDTLDHAILYKKLEFFGLGGNSLEFFRNYLSNRRQRITINSQPSNYVITNRGVPQGSILGPLLFTIYTADFYEYLSNCSIHQYADDTQVYFSFTFDNLHNALNRINFDLHTISRISKAHNLVLNETKTELLVFGKDSQTIIENPDFEIKINDKKIEPKMVCKNLGIYLDVKLRFAKHVNHVIQKSYGKLKILNIHKTVLSPNIKLKLCDSLILSLVGYCDILYWPALTQRDKVSLQKIQNACIRYSYNLRKFDHISSKFLESKWLNLNERFELHIACLTYKINKLETPDYLFRKLVKGNYIHSCPTRNCDLYNVPKHRYAQFQRSFSYNSAKIFNSLPQNVKVQSTIPTFRKHAKLHILAKRA